MTVFLSAKICQENIEINKFVEIDIVVTCKLRCNLLGAEQLAHEPGMNIAILTPMLNSGGNRTPDLTVKLWKNRISKKKSHWFAPLDVLMSTRV